MLSDGTDTYLYGAGRIAQYDASGAQYFLGDALGSVRQLVDAGGEVLLAQSYEPYGAVLESAGDGISSYGFAAEMRDPTGLIFLRARYYNSRFGRFLSKDTWPGDYNRPLSLNGWNYVEADPINGLDPSGRCLDADMDGKCDPGWRCSMITDPVAREACWQSSCSASDVEPPVVEPPGPNCNPDCADAYKTYKEVVTRLGHEPDIADILYMTAAKEYFAYVDKPYYNSQGYIKDPKAQNYPEPSVRLTGREALGRAYYEFCTSGETNCEGTQLYQYLSGYEPWCGKAGADNGDPRSRATILIKEGLENPLYGTGDELRDDVHNILAHKYPDWLLYRKQDGRPWQWFTTPGARFPLEEKTFGYAENNRAILAVEAGQGKYLWMLTALQDAKW